MGMAHKAAWKWSPAASVSQAIAYKPGARYPFKTGAVAHQLGANAAIIAYQFSAGRSEAHPVALRVALQANAIAPAQLLGGFGELAGGQRTEAD